MPIRPFVLGDMLLLQRLSRYATRFHIGRFLLQPSSPLQDAFNAYLPWAYKNGVTYMLRPEEYGPARVGFVQWQLHHSRAEADLLALAPALDAPDGHPAIWHKLLAGSALFLAEHQIRRLYSELSDQPLLVNTFLQAGFHIYARETIWRLVSGPPGFSPPAPEVLRPQTEADHWALEQLYASITPAPVRQAEMLEGESETGGEQTTPPPILTNHHLHQPLASFVLESKNGLDGCVQIIGGRTGIQLRVWADSNNPDTSRVHLLIRYGLQHIGQASVRIPVYISVRDYQGGLAAILEEYGFAPFTDRVRMLRPIWQRVKKAVESRLPSLETVAEAIPGSLALPQATAENRGSNGTSSTMGAYYHG